MILSQMILYNKTILFLMFFSFAAFALPKDDFAHTFELAKYSACKDVVKHTQQSNNPQIHQSKLKALSSGPFPWRFEITNGYQEGFVYYALKGIALENKGDIIAAYNAYQNSSVCIDEKASFAHRNPRHEIELAIGRIYLKCGRYYDAYNVFDTVRLESQDKNILIAADEGLINRAIAIGDYTEACEMYEYLGTMNTLTRKQFNGYAKVLFSLGRDRDAFAQLLYGIAKYGFDEDLGIKDPMVDLFLNALPRATDDEIKWYYDLVGYGIMDARAQKGDEKHLVMLLKTRMLFSTVFPFLKPEDDIKKLEGRIEYLKTNVKYQTSNRYKENAKGRHLIINNYCSSNKGVLNLTNKIEDIETTVASVENILMEVDLKGLLWLNDGKKKYNLIAKILTNNYSEYDGTRISDMINIGSVISESLRDGHTNIIKYIRKCRLNDEISLRLASIYLKFYSYYSKHDVRQLQENCKIIFEFANKVPLAFPPLLRYTENCAKIAFDIYDFPTLIKLCEFYEKHAGYLTPDMYNNLIKAYIAIGETSKAFVVGRKALSYFSPFKFKADYNSHDNYWFRKLCRSMGPWATDEELERFADIQLKSEVTAFLRCFQTGNAGYKLRAALQWNSKYKEEEIEYRNAIAIQDYTKAISLLTNSQSSLTFPWHTIKRADVYAQCNKTNAALQSISQYHENLTKFLYPIPLNTAKVYNIKFSGKINK